MKIASYAIKGLLFLLMCFSAMGKISMSAEVLAGMQKFGIPLNLVRPIGVIEILAMLVFVVPTRVEILGAILLTGFMGGAILTHLRVGEAALVQELIAILVWVAYFLRNPLIARAIYQGSKKNET